MQAGGNTCSRWSVAEYTLGGVNAQGHKFLWMQHGQLNYFSHLVNLLFAASNVTVGDIWLFLHCHHCHTSINLGRQGDLYLILGPVNTAGESSQVSGTVMRQADC